jgi:hypothetical protein
VLAHAAEIHPGDSLSDVQSTLGTPRGQAQIDDKLVLYYDRGQVQLVDGKVTSLNLISTEEFAAQQAQHVAEGQALKAQKLADPDFLSASPGAQLTFWQDFRMRYSEVSCDDEYNSALDHWKADQLKIAEQGNLIAAQQQPVAAQPQDSAPTAQDTQDTQAPAPPQVADQPQPQQPCNDQPPQPYDNQPQPCQPDQPPQSVAEQQPDVPPQSPPDSGSASSSPTNTIPVLLPFQIMHL